MVVGKDISEKISIDFINEWTPKLLKFLSYGSLNIGLEELVRAIDYTLQESLFQSLMNTFKVIREVVELTDIKPAHIIKFNSAASEQNYRINLMLVCTVGLWGVVVYCSCFRIATILVQKLTISAMSKSSKSEKLSAITFLFKPFLSLCSCDSASSQSLIGKPKIKNLPIGKITQLNPSKFIEQEKCLINPEAKKQNKMGKGEQIVNRLMRTSTLAQKTENTSINDNTLKHVKLDNPFSEVGNISNVSPPGLYKTSDATIKSPKFGIQERVCSKEVIDKCKEWCSSHEIHKKLSLNSIEKTTDEKDQESSYIANHDFTIINYLKKTTSKKDRGSIYKVADDSAIINSIEKTTSKKDRDSSYRPNVNDDFAIINYLEKTTSKKDRVSNYKVAEDSAIINSIKITTSKKDRDSSFKFDDDCTIKNFEKTLVHKYSSHLKQNTSVENINPFKTFSKHSDLWSMNITCSINTNETGYFQPSQICSISQKYSPSSSPTILSNSGGETMKLKQFLSHNSIDKLKYLDSIPMSNNQCEFASIEMQTSKSWESLKNFSQKLKLKSYSNETKTVNDKQTKKSTEKCLIKPDSKIKNTLSNRSTNQFESQTLEQIQPKLSNNKCMTAILSKSELHNTSKKKAFKSNEDVISSENKCSMSYNKKCSSYNHIKVTPQSQFLENMFSENSSMGYGDESMAFTPESYNDSSKTVTTTSTDKNGPLESSTLEDNSLISSQHDGEPLLDSEISQIVQPIIVKKEFIPKKISKKGSTSKSIRDNGAKKHRIPKDTKTNKGIYRKPVPLDNQNMSNICYVELKGTRKNEPNLPVDAYIGFHDVKIPNKKAKGKILKDKLKINDRTYSVSVKKQKSKHKVFVVEASPQIISVNSGIYAKPKNKLVKENISLPVKGDLDCKLNHKNKHTSSNTLIDLKDVSQDEYMSFKNRSSKHKTKIVRTSSQEININAQIKNDVHYQERGMSFNQSSQKRLSSMNLTAVVDCLVEDNKKHHHSEHAVQIVDSKQRLMDYDEYCIYKTSSHPDCRPNEKCLTSALENSPVVPFQYYKQKSGHLVNCQPFSHLNSWNPFNPNANEKTSNEKLCNKVNSKSSLKLKQKRDHSLENYPSPTKFQNETSSFEEMTSKHLMGRKRHHIPHEHGEPEQITQIVENKSSVVHISDSVLKTVPEFYYNVGLEKI